jgi:hypothetical protein
MCVSGELACECELVGCQRRSTHANGVVYGLYVSRRTTYADNNKRDARPKHGYQLLHFIAPAVVAQSRRASLLYHALSSAACNRLLQDALALTLTVNRCF